VANGVLSATQSVSIRSSRDMKTLNSPEGNWLRRRKSRPRRTPSPNSPEATA
jgi:hypothetical protein